MGVEILTEDSNIWLAAGADSNLELVKQYLANSEPQVTANSWDDNGYTPLHAASSYNNIEIMNELVLNHKGNPNLLDRDGDTPLHVAETAEMAQLLLKLGTDPTIKNKKGHLAIQIADREGYTDVVQVLKKYTPEYEKISDDEDSDFDIDELEQTATHVRDLLQQYGINVSFEE